MKQKKKQKKNGFVNLIKIYLILKNLIIYLYNFIF